MTEGNARESGMERLLRSALRPQPGVADPCPDPGLLAAFVEGALTANEEAALDSHIAACGRCQEALAVMAHALPEDAAESVTEPGPSGWFTWATRPRLRWLVPISAAATVAVVIFATRPLIAPEGEAPGTEVARMAQAPSEPAAAEVSRLDALRNETPPPAKELVAPKGQQETVITRVGQAPDAKQIAAAPADVPEAGGRMRDKQAVEPAAEMMAARVASEEKRAQPAAPAPAPPIAAPGAVARQATSVPVAADVSRKPVAAEADRGAPASAGSRMEAGSFQGGQVTVFAPGGAVRWRFGAGGRIARTLDAGETWQVQVSGVTASLLAGAAPSPATCWLVGAAGTVLLTTDGERWERRPFPLSVDLTVVEAVSPLAAIITARDGRRFETLDGGLTWTPKQ